MKDAIDRVRRITAYADKISKVSRLLSNNLPLGEKEKLVWHLWADLRDAEDMRPADGWPDQRTSYKDPSGIGIWVWLSGFLVAAALLAYLVYSRL